MSRIEESLYNSVSKYGVKLNEDINGEPIIYVNSRKVINQDRNEDWDAPNSCFDDLDYYGPYVPQEKYIVDIKDKSGNSISYEELCQYLLNDEEAWYELKYKKPVTESYDDVVVETTLEWSVDKDELEAGIKELKQKGIEVLNIDQPDEDWFEFEIDVRGKKSVIRNELIKDYGSKEEAEEFYPELFESYITEAVNPENEEANAIIKKYLGKKGMPNKKEQAVLDKYGIKKDEYGRFIGPKGAILYGDRTSVSGPSKPGRTTRSAWGNKYRSNSQPFGWFDKSKTGGKYKNPEDVDALDKIDYANYLTKVDPDELRGKNKEWSVDVENEHAMKPYSEPYKDAKKDAKYERRRQQSEIDDILADEKEIERRQRSIERSRENAKKHAENAAKAEQDRKDILAKARAKHSKTNESLNKKKTLTESYHGSTPDMLLRDIEMDLDEGFEQIVINAINEVFNASSNKDRTYKKLSNFEDYEDYFDDYDDFLANIEDRDWVYDGTSFGNPWSPKSPEGKLFYKAVQSQCGPLITIKVESYGDEFCRFDLVDDALKYFIK